MKTFLIRFFEMTNGQEFTEMLSAYDENHAYLKAREIEISEAAMIMTIEEV